MIGKTLAHYEIVALLGQGGMGEVYRAHDTKLDRKVALKILAREVSTDPERQVRLQREARAMARLQHPNVATVHGLEEDQGTRFLVMELIEGEDLSAWSRRRRRSIADKLAIAAQIAAGLAAAHEHGIVHRDLKPTNIKITPSGTAKILDFGIASMAEGDVCKHGDGEPTVAIDRTQTGLILGTAAYMCPEQTRGEELDARADLWALGCIVYEMLTGRRCFEGDTVSDLLVQVLTREPDWKALPPQLPEIGRQLLRQLLEKDPQRRMRDAHDVGLLLDLVRTEVETPDSSSAPAPWSGARRRILVGAPTGLLLVVLVAVSILRPWSTPPHPFDLLAGASFTRMTNFEGSENNAAISRDGQTVAFVSDHRGRSDVWVIPVETSQPVDLTKGAVSDLMTPLRSLGFFPGGSELWLAGMPGQRLRRMPTVGGPPRNWLDENAINVSFSPDGERIVLHDKRPGDPLVVADRNGSNRRGILDSGAGYHQHFPTWGRDGWIYLVRGQETTGEMDLWRLRPDGTSLERLTWGVRNPAHPTPVDSKTLLYVALDDRGAGPWLWALDLEERRTLRLSYGLEQFTSLAADAQGRRLVASISNPHARLWQVPISDTVATENDVTAVELPNLRALAPRFGPRALFYLSSRGSGDGLWRYDEGKSQEIWKGTEAPLLDPVAISADGSSIAIVLRKNGRNALHVLSRDGAELRALSHAVDILGTVSWSPDAEWIVAGGEDAEGRTGLFRIDVDADRVEMLLEGQAVDPVWSPAGDLILYAGAQVDAFTPILGVRPDGEPVEMPPIDVLANGEYVRFLPDGHALIYMSGSGNLPQDFWLVDMETRRERRLTQLEHVSFVRSFDVTPDGRHIVFDRVRDDSDVVLIELAER